jgi:UDP-glucose 4-epimerase
MNDKMRILVTGGAGFIASNLTERLLNEGYRVVSVDNFLLGKPEYIEPFRNNPKFEFKKIDLLDREMTAPVFMGVDAVFHLSANSDILEGTRYTDRDLSLGTIVTYNVLEAMRLNSVKNIVFASTSAVYGMAEQIPTKEDYGPLLPISLYGASKLACEALISAFCHNFDMKSWVFRFSNVIGKNPTHGIIFDLIKKLKNNPYEIEVLGDGQQSKPYLHVSDIIDGMLFGFFNSQDEANLFNLACDDASSVEFIVKTLLKKLKMENTKILYTGGKQGWKGDVPQVRLSVEKMRKLGWTARFSSQEAILKGIDEIISQLW